MDLNKLMQEEAELEKQFFGGDVEDLEDTTLKDTPEEIEEEESTDEEVIVPTEQEVISDDQVDWKKRFTNYKASTDITIRDLRRDLAQATSDIVAYQDKIDELSKEVSLIKSNSEDEYKDLFSEEDADIVGQDAIDIFKKGVKKAAESSTAPLKEELEKLRKKERKLKEEASKAELAKIYKDHFHDPLKRLVPDFEQLNTNPQFIEFLQEPDEETGIQRITLLRKAESVYDPGRAASFFREFKKSIGKNNLESKITPVANGNSTSNDMRTTKPRTFTMAEIDKNYNDQAKGVYRGREKEWRILEAQMDKAFEQGNIIP